MKHKFNILFKLFFLSLVGLTVGYSLLHWLIFIKLELFPLKEMIVNFGIPAVLTGAVTLFLLRPKFKILNLERKNGNLRNFYSVIVWIALSAPLIIAQEYIVTATGKLTELNSINSINNSESTKYYKLKSFYIEKRAIGVHSAFEVSGKHNEYFNMHIYVAMPIFESAKDSIKDQPTAWLGVEYSKQISNRLESEEKEKEYQKFASESQKDFDRKDVAKFIYLDRIGASDDRDGYIEAIKKNPVFQPNETILIGVNEPFESRNGGKLKWVFLSSLIGLAVWVLMIVIPKIDERELKRIQAGKPDRVAQREWRDFLDFLKPKQHYFITPILIYLNIGLFLLMMLMGLGFASFKGQDLLNWGANFKPYTTDGQWWRLLTNTFLHGGIMHILANMYGLVFVGIFLEPLLGRVKYLMVYLATGILASIASIWWYDATVSVGASGAIFGLYGLFLALLVTKLYPPDFAKSFLISTGVFVGVNLLMGLAGGIDNAAHIGGLVSGFVIGLILYPSLKEQVENEELGYN